MSRRREAAIAWSFFAATAGLMAISLTLAFLSRHTPNTEEFSWTATDTIDELAFLLYPLVGAVIAWKRPRNPIGWLLLIGSLIQETNILAGNYAVHGLAAEPGSLPAAGFASWYFEVSWIVPTAALPLLFLIFPNGRLLTRRWRFVAYATFVPVVMVMGFVGVQTWRFRGRQFLLDPEGIPGLAEAESLVVPALIALLITFGAAVASLVLRFRRANPIERQQLKWLAMAAFVLLVNLLDNVFIPYIRQLLGTVAFSLVPVAIGMAILRYRLYDIDRLINKSLVYGVLTAVLVAGYAGSVLLIQSLLPLSNDSPVAVAVSTLAMAALFGPLRHRIQRVVDRRFYRARYDAARTIESFGSRLRQETDLDALGADLIGVVRHTLEPAHASLWLTRTKDRT